MERPRGPSNSLIIFAREVRAEVQQANPGLTDQEIVRLLANMWSRMSLEERAPYSELAREDILRYNQEMAIWQAQLTPLLATAFAGQEMDTFEIHQPWRTRHRTSPPTLPTLPRLTLEDKMLATGRSDQICQICQGELNKPDELGLDLYNVVVIKLIKCRHKFHKQCILNWASSRRKVDSNGNPAISCPVCRILSFGKRLRKSRKRKSGKRKSGKRK